MANAITILTERQKALSSRKNIYAHDYNRQVSEIGEQIEQLDIATKLLSEVCTGTGSQSALIQLDDLEEKRADLVDSVDILKRKYEQKVEDVNKELAQIAEALKLIKKAADPYRCKACAGTGIRITADAAGDREERTCKSCHGTGYDYSL